ncbi:MAG TPA: protein TolR [Pseudoxanthomonas sp.]|nr:protein TolR [Pseudoxanthomonas sp.]
MTATISQRKRRKLKSEINVVPYIDVMLVLLIIFMVTAPLLTLSVDVDLPVANAKAVQDKTLPIIVTVGADGAMTLALPEGEQQAVDAAGLENTLAAIAREDPDVRVVVAGDGQGSYQGVIDAMQILQRAKVTKVGLLTQSNTAGGNAR